MKTKSENFQTLMNRLSRRHGIHNVFSDFLTMSVCALSMGRHEELYLKTVRKYEKPEAYILAEAFGALVIEMTGDGSGLVDILGSFFEEHISHGRNGQFFTPQPVCDMIAKMQNPKARERILDPACGSGRMLMAAAKISHFSLFYGADVDGNCAKMTTINMCLNGMFGEVAWMNSLTNQYYGGWQILPGKKGCPTIREISEDESYIHLKLPEQRKALQKLPVQKVLFEF